MFAVGVDLLYHTVETSVAFEHERVLAARVHCDDDSLVRLLHHLEDVYLHLLHLCRGRSGSR